jgi:hypothetical protein
MDDELGKALAAQAELFAWLCAPDGTRRTRKANVTIRTEAGSHYGSLYFTASGLQISQLDLAWIVPKIKQEKAVVMKEFERYTS